MKKLVQRALLAFVTLLVVAVSYLWLTFASPWGYKPVADSPAIDDRARYSVFVYGTLKQPWLRALVMGRAGTAEPAQLPGYQKEALDIRPAPDAVTAGLLINVSGKELRALDRYERLGVRYERVELPLNNGQTAWVYRLINAQATDIPDH